MRNATQPRPRFHDLDALRGFLMLLIVVIHAIPFIVAPVEGHHWPAYDQWALNTPPERNPYFYLVILIYGFTLPLFFLLSGYFTALTWKCPRLIHHGIRLRTRGCVNDGFKVRGSGQHCQNDSCEG